MYQQYRTAIDDKEKMASQEEISAAIDAVQLGMKKLWNEQNPDGFIQYYTDDVRQVIPGVGIVVGKEEVVSRVKKEMDQVESWESNSVHRTIGDTIVSDLLRFKLKLKAMDKVMEGTAMVTYVKEDGKWKIKYDMDVPDM